MPAAFGADPELVWCPRHAGAWIAHVHLRAAALAADLKGVAHAAILPQRLMAERARRSLLSFMYAPSLHNRNSYTIAPG